MDQYSLTQAQVAEVIGKSRSTVTNTLRILNLDPRVIDLALQGKLTEGHCKALLGFENPDKQYDMAVYMIESGDSVREAEKKLNLERICQRRMKNMNLFIEILKVVSKVSLVQR